jgi:hypothetical protein
MPASEQTANVLTMPDRHCSEALTDPLTHSMAVEVRPIDMAALMKTGSLDELASWVPPRVKCTHSPGSFLDSLH